MGFIRRISKLWPILPAALWVLAILRLSRQTYAQQSIRPLLRKLAPKEVIRERLPNVTIHYDGAAIVAHQEPYRFIEFFFRKGAHLTVYAVLAVCAAYALRKLPVLRGRRFAVRAAALGTALLVAIADESLQSRAALRTPTPLDVGVDLVGAAAGLAIGWGFDRMRNARERKEGE